MLALFQIQPDVELEAMRPNQQLSELTATLVRELSRTFQAAQPDWVLVQGDTTTTFCAALAAFYTGIPVGHVEAGLRTRDLYSPFPEEANRRLVALAGHRFISARRLATPRISSASEWRRRHLRDREHGDRRVAVGRRKGTGIAPARPAAARRRILLTLHRRENHGEPSERLCGVVRSLAARGDTEVILPVHANPAVQDVVRPALTGVEGVALCEPFDYLSLVQVLDSCDLVLTDSGGLQEEAPTLGKPVLVLRDNDGAARSRRCGRREARRDRVRVLFSPPRHSFSMTRTRTQRWRTRKTRSGTAERASCIVDVLSERQLLQVAA